MVLARKIQSMFRRLSRFLNALAVYAFNGFLTHVPGYSLRTTYLRCALGYDIGRGTAVHMGCFFTGDHIHIGQHTVINRRTYLDGRGELRIGDNVSISPEVYVLTATHAVDDPRFAPDLRGATIEDDVWIGARAIILPGVTLGRGTVVGAGAVVTRSTEPYAVVVGNPARKIRERSRDLNYTLRYFPWFNTDIGM